MSTKFSVGWCRSFDREPSLSQRLGIVHFLFWIGDAISDRGFLLPRTDRGRQIRGHRVKIDDSLSNDHLLDLLLGTLPTEQRARRARPRKIERKSVIVPAARAERALPMRGKSQKPLDPMSLARSPGDPLHPYYTTDRGMLFEGDCLDYLARFRSDLVDTVFADPPFNLGKTYGKRTNDSRADEEYVEWCRGWLAECVRVLMPGGALFVYNLPKWNIILGAFLMQLPLMQFRHSIAIEIKSCLPIPGRLYPAHYSLLYLTKGKPKTFRRIRTPIETCRHCNGEIRDYGGHRGAMNPLGVNLKDVWTDIPPVRHWRFKSRKRPANALSTKILDRAVEMTTKPGEIVLDPFGGSGTTYAVCEQRDRRWIGIELDSCPEIVDRLQQGAIGHHRNEDFVDDPQTMITEWPTAAD
jgi:site-specific DNA-methyltransferase (adenine-specific)